MSSSLCLVLLVYVYFFVITSGKYEIDTKYIGYNVNNFFMMKILNTENTTVLNIIAITKNKLNIKIIIKKNKSNSPKKKKSSEKNKSIKKIFEQINLSNDKIEMVLLTNKIKIYKVFQSNDYIFPNLAQEYELVAYEKDNSN